MAENDKNYDRFFKIYKVRTYASNSQTIFDGLTGTGPSSVVDITDSPMVTWTLQVTGVPSPATAWVVDLEGSVDGVTFTQILRHTTLEGDGESVFSGTTLFLASFYRVRVVSLTLGGATSISAKVIGKQ